LKKRRVEYLKRLPRNSPRRSRKFTSPSKLKIKKKNEGRKDVKHNESDPKTNKLKATKISSLF